MKMVTLFAVFSLIFSLYSVSFAASDVPVGHWAFDMVDMVVDKGYLSLFPDGQFHGDVPVSRFTISSILVTLEDKLEEVNSKILSLEDQINAIMRDFEDKVLQLEEEQSQEEQIRGIEIEYLSQAQREFEARMYNLAESLQVLSWEVRQISEKIGSSSNDNTRGDFWGVIHELNFRIEKNREVINWIENELAELKNMGKNYSDETTRSIADAWLRELDIIRGEFGEIAQLVGEMQAKQVAMLVALESLQADVSSIRSSIAIIENQNEWATFRINDLESLLNDYRVQLDDNTNRLGILERTFKEVCDENEEFYGRLSQVEERLTTGEEMARNNAQAIDHLQDIVKRMEKFLEEFHFRVLSVEERLDEDWMVQSQPSVDRHPIHELDHEERINRLESLVGELMSVVFELQRQMIRYEDERAMIFELINDTKHYIATMQADLVDVITQLDEFKNSVH